MPSQKQKELGILGENKATVFLQNLGYEILDRNWRTKKGELDIVARRPNGIIVFCEVKARSSKTYGDPLEAINNKKFLQVYKLALAWMLLHGIWELDFEIDCLGVTFQEFGKFSIDHRIAVNL